MIFDKDLFYPTGRLRQYGHSAKHGGDASCGGMIVENQRDKGDSQYSTSGDAPSQLIPHGKEVDFLTPPLFKHISLDQKIRQDGEESTKHEFQHGLVPPFFGLN